MFVVIWERGEGKTRVVYSGSGGAGGGLTVCAQAGK